MKVTSSEPLTERGGFSVGLGLARLLVNVFFLYAGSLTLVQGVRMARLKRGWLVGDWLINYEGGFVRRGLAGELLLLLARLLRVGPATIATACFIGLSMVYVVSLWGLAVPCFRSSESFGPRKAWLLALLLSPAALSYQLMRASVAFRKEVLFLAGLSLFAFVLSRRSLSWAGVSNRAVTGFLVVFAVVCTLSHEGLFFYFPYFFAALVAGGRSFREAARMCALPALAGSIAFAACALHTGNAATVSRICSSLGYGSYSVVQDSTDICQGGAIPYLATTRHAAADETAAMVRDYGFLWVFPCYVALALIPAIGESAMLARAGGRLETKALWASAAVSLLLTLVLFRFAIDWGRWISIHISSITVLLFLIEAKRSRLAQTVDEATAIRPSRARTVAYAAMVLLFATCWTLPNDLEPLRMGYVGRALEAVHVLPRPHQVTRVPSR